MPVDPGKIAGTVFIPGGVVVALGWTLPSNKVVLNVLHGSVAGGFSATSAVAQAIFAGLTGSADWTNYKALLNTATSLKFVQLRDIRGPILLPLVQSTGVAAAGTAVGGALPAGTALVVTERTASAGRGFRGRIFLPGLDRTALQADGTVSSTNQALAVALITQLQTQMTAQSITLALANPARAQYTGRKGAVHPARAAAMVTVTSILSRSGILNSQRRRSQVA